MPQLVWPASCLHVADRSLFWYLSSGVANVHSNSKRTTKYVFLPNKLNFSIFRRQKFKYCKIWGFYHDQRLLQFYERLYILCILICLKDFIFLLFKKNYIFKYIYFRSLESTLTCAEELEKGMPTPAKCYPSLSQKLSES